MTDGWAMRAYMFHARPPVEGAGDMDAAVARKRALWDALVSIQNRYDTRYGAIRAGDARPDEKKEALAVLRAWRTDRFREAKRAAAADGLHWGDYNAVVAQFDGAVRAARQHKAAPGSDEGRLGHALVNQVMNGCSWRGLRDGDNGQIRIMDEEPDLPKRRRSQRWMMAEFTVRGPRNPDGPAKLRIPFLMHREVPTDATVMEGRVIRSMRLRTNPAHGRVWTEERWSVVFVARVPMTERKPGVAGVMLSWGEDFDFEAKRLCTVAWPDGRVQTFVVPERHDADWARHAALKADAGNDEAARADLAMLEKRLFDRRKDHHRRIAALIADRAGTVVLPDVRLPPGAKGHGGMSALALAIANAVAGSGGEVAKKPPGRLRCHVCGQECKAPKPHTDTVVCDCGARWKPHENGARNLLRAGMEAENAGAQERKSVELPAHRSVSAPVTLRAGG